MKKLLFIFIAIILTPVFGFTKTRIPEPNSPGGKILLSTCNTCHATPHPKRFKIQRWPQILDMMELSMQERGINFSSEDREALLDYLRKHSD